MNYALLTDRAVLAVSGADAADFLQGLITKDVRKMAADKMVFAALLSPQGRFLFDFFIVRHDDRFLFDTNKSRLPDLIKRLKMYRLRSKVEFAELPDMQVAAVWGEGGQTPEGSYADPRLVELGWRVLNAQAADFSGMIQGDYHAHRISLGVPEGSMDLVFDRSILLEYGYDELGGVDFDKGCYVGQEVTARSKHRASLRKFIHIVQSDSSLPAKGTPVMAGEHEAGFMASMSGTIGLAHLRVDEVSQAAQEQKPLLAGGITLTARLPHWCKTAFA